MFFGLLFSAAALFANASEAIVLPQNETASFMFVYLDAGTIVSFSLMEEVDATTVSVGNAIYFEVNADVKVNEKIVIKSGVMAEGIVKKVVSGCDGKCSSITITVENVETVDGQRIRIQSIPHTLKAPCCDGTAVIPIGTHVKAATLNKAKIKA